LHGHRWLKPFSRNRILDIMIEMNNKPQIGVGLMLSNIALAY